MPPWPFFQTSASKSGSPRAITTPEAIERESDYLTGQTRSDTKGAGNDSTDPTQLLDLEPPNLPFAPRGSPKSQTSPSHTRSLSSTLFGRKRTNTNSDAGPSSPAKTGNGPPSPRKTLGHVQLDEEETESGTCATCAAKVKWPKSAMEWRCTTCLMINDLSFGHARVAPSPRSTEQPMPRTGTFQGNSSEKRAIPLTLERTQAIIGRCVDHHLQERRRDDQSIVYQSHPHLNSSNIANVSPPKASGPVQTPSTPPGNTFAEVGTKAPSELTASSAGSALPQRIRPTPSPAHSSSLPRVQPQSRFENTPPLPSRKPPHPPQTMANTPSQNILSRRGQSPMRRVEMPPPLPASQLRERSRHQLAKTIFKPLEEYIMNTFGQFDCLNSSFSSFQPRTRTVPHSDQQVSNHETASNPIVFDTQTTNLDPRMLMIGDVAENGLWWAGRENGPLPGDRKLKSDRYDAPSNDLVNSRSPHIHWSEVMQWYELVVRAGDGWRETLEGNSISEEDMNKIDLEFLEARLHVQKVLLRASESVLKRPGRPLKGPSDIRFLLILLANPLLYPSSTSPVTSRVATELEAFRRLSDEFKTMGEPEQNTTKPPLIARGGYWEQGYAYGIIKRTFGLLANLPNECHRYLSAWFARYNEDRFRRLVDLAQSFVTYRLGRQHSRKQSHVHLAPSYVPELSGTGAETSAQLHAALGLASQPKKSNDTKGKLPAYSDDWQIKGTARVMALLFAANRNFQGERTMTSGEDSINRGSISRQNIKHHGQLLSMSAFYNLKADTCDLVADLDCWESGAHAFTFCQYPFFFSVGSKIRIMEHDARRQMDVKAREAFFNSILNNQSLQQHLFLKVRRDCLVDDSLTAISEVIAQGQEEIKKGLRISFAGEEGIDAGGLRKEWFLLLVREIFDPNHGMFIYDEDSNFCYFNPHSFETSDQYHLVGALLGLAIYNLTILDIALPPFLFKKLLSAGSNSGKHHAFGRTPMQYSLEDLAEYRPLLAKGLRQLLEFEGNVQETFCRDFVAEVDRYGSTTQVPLCANGEKRAVTNSNRQEFVDLYVRFLLDTQVLRQFEPFKRGFFEVCGGNALSLFQPEEIELLIRGSDEQLDVASLKAVALYDNWRRGDKKIEKPLEQVNLIQWFWEFMESAEPKAQRKVLGFITGSDRIPAMGATSLVIKISFAGKDFNRFPIARTCFNSLLLYKYRTKEELVDKLWRAVCESEGFGLR